ncbi:MAG: hypothetical protein K2I49_00950, partial [Ureaplasma sp.]|nr:hypothetical protein [Ureaplasma sp.]
MSKKTIVIGTLSSLLITGGVVTAAGILVNAASKTEGISLDQGVNFTTEDINGLLDSFQNEIKRNKYTSSQFANKIKDIVSSNLKLEGKNASSLIESATYSANNKEIVITLKSEYRYTLPQSYSNISLSSSTTDGNLNIITISNLQLDFYTSYTFSKLNDIYNAFNNIILNSKYTQVEFENYFNENIELIKELVVQNLWISNTQKINPELIEEISLINNQVQITFKTGYFSYNLGGNLANIILSNNLMTIRNFNFYKSIVIEVSKLNSLKSNIQNYIDKQENQFTREEFVAQINSLSFKNEVASQLGILSTEINKISYENNILTITPNDMQKFDASVANNNFIVNNNIQVENFNFYQSQTLTQTENLFLKLNEYIANAKYTSEEFADKVNSKDATVAKIINDNLLISTPNETDPDKETFTPINPDQIVNYTFENNKLLINLDTNSLKYNLASTNNVSIDNGTLIVKNFTFYTSVVIEDAKLNSFKSSVQSLIDTNKYTQSDFESQLSSLAFRNSIATSLGIVASNINAINFSNNTLEITPLQNQKFVSSIPTNNNSNLVNDNVQVSSFTFFSSFTITNTNNLFNSLQNYISSNSDTIDEFKTKVNSNDTTITSLIQDNLLVIEDQSTKPIDTNYITNFEFTNNQL